MLPYSVELSVGEVYTPPNFDQAEIYWAVSDSSLLTQEADGFRALAPGLVTLTRRRLGIVMPMRRAY